jgi:hypothetical protein
MTWGEGHEKKPSTNEKASLPIRYGFICIHQYR